MQNKARLELADYEAVSTLSFCLSAIARKLSVQCRHCACTIMRWHSEFPVFITLLKKKRAETVSSGALKSQNALFPAKSHYLITDFLQVIFLISIWQNPVIYWPQNVYIYRSNLASADQYSLKRGITAVMISCCYTRALQCTLII